MNEVQCMFLEQTSIALNFTEICEGCLHKEKIVAAVPLKFEPPSTPLIIYIFSQH